MPVSNYKKLNFPEETDDDLYQELIAIRTGIHDNQSLKANFFKRLKREAPDFSKKNTLA